LERSVREELGREIVRMPAIAMCEEDEDKGEVEEREGVM
jgi:hypothetical protein